MSAVNTFSPKLLEVWRKATLEKLELSCESKAQATTLRHRLYKLRTALKAEGHELATSADRIKLRLVERNGTWFLIAEPADSSFDDILERAGVAIPDAPELE